MDKSAIADPLVGRLLDERYRVEAKIARGGMATVYVATDLRLDRRIALKVMPHALADDSDFAQRFVREARAAARLTHPNVVAVYDQGEDNGVLFLAMEYVEGRHTLRDVVRDEAPLAPIRAVAILEEILRALSAAHESGIIHRDIKPENVLINPRGQVKVADFGLARAITSSTNATATGGVLMGTVSYLPPELVLDGTADARSDVYSIGVLLFELLTGTKPHVAETPLQVAYKHVHEDVPPPSTLAAGIPPYLDAFVARATARQRDLRPADAHVMLQQLRRVRHALEHGVVDDQELTEDLTPTIAVSSLGSHPPAAAGSADWGGPPRSTRSPTDEVFDQEAVDAEARTMIVGSPAYRTDSTVEQPPSGHEHSPVYAPPAGPSAPRRQRRRKGGWIALLVVLLLAATAAMAGWYYGVARFQSTPNVAGMSQLAAAAKLDESGLTLDVNGTAYSETVPIGALISTDPRAGANVLKGGTVHAVISKGPERHDVPDLQDLTEAEAVDTITAHFLKVGPVTREWSDTVAAGTLISFTPKSGTPLRRDAPVSLVVSKGPEPITVPDWTGKIAERAKTALTALGFLPHEVARYDDTVPAGAVVSQSPADGVGHRGDTIALVVSKGPHLVAVPDVSSTATGQADAESALRAAGFQVDVQHNTPYFGLGYVVNQSPGSGEMAPYGSTITIYIV